MGGEGNFEDKSAVSSAPFTPYCSLLRLQLIIPLWILFTFVLDFPDTPCDFLGQQGNPAAILSMGHFVSVVCDVLHPGLILRTDACYLRRVS